MTTAPTWLRKLSPLLIPAAVLSIASFAWTTWSLVDLLGTGKIGVTVAAGADIIWASVIVAEARGLRIPNPFWRPRNLVPAFGWAALLVVAGFLAWHGINRHSAAMAVAGPFLPLGAKTVWALALADMRDPAALTDDELLQLAALERGMRYEEQQHSATMRRRRMGAELLMNEIDTDYDIEMRRQGKARELQRRRPLELTAALPSATLDARPDNTADTSGQPDTAPDKLPGQQDAETPVEPPASADTPPDTPDPLVPLAAKATGPTDLIKALAAHGVPADNLVSEAVRLRPDMVADSIRRTAKRLRTEAGPYL